jgi:hypothetical protein
MAEPKRPCIGIDGRGCPTGAVVPAGHSRCAGCQRGRERQRGTRQERGYDARHDRLRARYQRRMDAGERFTCWRCLEERGVRHDVDPASWDLGHQGGKHRGPECPARNRATAGRRPGG